MVRAHVIGDLFIGEFLPVEVVKSAEGPAYRLVAIPGTDVARAYPSLGGAARVAALIAPTVDDVRVTAPIPAKSEALRLLKAVTTRAGRHVAVTPLKVVGTNARIARYYRQQPESRWELVQRVEFPERWEVDKASDIPPVEPVDVIVVADFGSGFVTPELLDHCLANVGTRVVLYAGHRDATDSLIRGQSTIVLCSDQLALAWTGMQEQPQHLPEGDPDHYMNLLVAILAALQKRFPSAAQFVVTCQPLTDRCFVFTPDLVARGTWRVYQCRVHDDRARPREHQAPPGAKTAFIAAFARALLRTTVSPEQSVQAALGAIASVNKLQVAGVSVTAEGFGRPEQLPDTLPTSMKTWSGLIDEATLTAPISPPEGLLGRATLYGRLPPSQEILPGYYVPSSARDHVLSLVDALSAYLSRPMQKRPFNILLRADPGSGKSYFVECLARRVRGLAAGRGQTEDLHPLLTVNFSAITSVAAFEEQLLDVYNDIRDERAAGRIPLVMLDEFDTLLSREHASVQDAGMGEILAKMLGPLWDGVFYNERKVRRLGGFVLIMVASDSTFLERLDVGKGRDFETRLDIRFELPHPVNTDEIFESNVRVALSMLAKHFGADVDYIELAVLHALGRADFPRRNRGIDQLFLLSKRPPDRVFRLEHLAPESLRNPRIINNLDVVTAEKTFRRDVISCR